MSSISVCRRSEPGLETPGMCVATAGKPVVVSITIMYAVYATLVGKCDASPSRNLMCICRTTGLTLASNGNQIQTPECGACAPGFEPFDPSYFNGSVSGVRSIPCTPVQTYMALFSVAASHTNPVTSQPGLCQPDHLEGKHGSDW